MTDTVPAITFIRFSTPQQEEGSSEERQRNMADAMIAEHGWTEIEEVSDLGRSGWKTDYLTKSNFGKLLHRIKDGEFAGRPVVLVVEDWDRLSRQKALLTLSVITDITNVGIKIAITATGKIYDSDNLAANTFAIMEILMKAQAAWESSDRLSRLVKASYAKRLKEARIDFTPVTKQGPAFIEWSDEENCWKPVPKRMKLVIEILEMARAGVAPWDIAKVLNERPVLSFTDKAWERTAIVKIIRNPALEGDKPVGEGKASTPTGEVMRGYYSRTPFVPLDLLADARANLDRRQIRKGKGRNSGVIRNLFGQKLRCGQCGGRMMLTGYQSRYLVCYDASRGNGCDHKDTFKYRPMEAELLDTVLSMALDDRFFRQGQKSNTLGLEIATVEKAIRDKAAEADRLVKMLSRIESPTVEANLVEIESEVAALKTKLTDLNAKLAQAQGAATAEERLRRVLHIREALNHAQDDIRLPARLKVAEALDHIIERIDCAAWSKDRKSFHVTLKVPAQRIEDDGRRVAVGAAPMKLMIAG